MSSWTYGSFFPEKGRKLHVNLSTGGVDYRVTDSCLPNVVSVHAIRVYGEWRYTSTHF
jgi:hypothetical protein